MLPNAHKTRHVAKFSSQSKSSMSSIVEKTFDCSCVPEHTEKVFTNLEIVLISHIECVVDGSNKGIKGDSIVFDKGNSKPVESAKKKHRSVRTI